MNNAAIGWLLVLVAFVLRVEGFGCPGHCFCYMWGGLARTDCVRRNLLNTFLGFSHETQILDLSHNVISILHGNEFVDANLRHLQDLRLSNNEIHKIDKLSFNGLALLQNLDLSFNSIEYLNPTTFKHNPNLKTLNVSFNPLSFKKDEPFLLDGSSLQILDMTNCRLEFVTLGSFSHLPRLRVLNMSRNHIRTIEPAFLKEMKSLRYLDVSKNVLPCSGDQTKILFRLLEENKIQFQTFCRTRQKILMSSIIEKEERDTFKVEMYQDYSKNITQKDSPERTVLDVVSQFFQSIPSFYAIVCGIQVGIFIGSFSTYFCLKRSFKNPPRNINRERIGEGSRRRCKDGETENLPFALIPLHAPPGTPPSPYHSRFFSSDFSLSGT